MLIWCFGFTLFCVCANVISSPIIPCKVTDAECLDKFGPLLYPKLFQEDPAIGLQSLDPMHLDEVDGSLSILKYKLLDTTVKGFKDCNIENLKFNAASLVLQTEMLCPAIQMSGKYNMHGRLIILPVEGTGDYSIKTKSYRIACEIEFKAVENDKKKYFAVKNFKLNSKPIDPVVFDFTNLFNGQKDLADAVLKFANENWKDVAKDFQAPILNADFKKIMSNLNKLLKFIPLEDLILL